MECEREYIRFSVPTRKAFRGRVYVKGEYGKDECVRNYMPGTACSASEFKKSHSGASDNVGLRITKEHGQRSGSQEGGGAFDPKQHQPPYFRKRPDGRYESPRFPNSAKGWEKYIAGQTRSSEYRVRPDANGECPLTCPPCEDCRDNGAWKSVGPRARRQTETTEAALEIQLGTCNLRRDRTVS